MRYWDDPYFLNMNIYSFSEGSLKRTGGIGIYSVPKIAKSLADRGHSVVVSTGGQIILDAESSNHINIENLDRDENGPGKCSFIVYPSFGKWQFSSSMYWKSRQNVKDADFIMLHSLYTFPVLVGYLLARRYNVPFGLWLHGVLAPFQRTIGATKKAIYNRLFARSILDNASVIIFTAEGEREETLPLDLKAPSVVIPLGFDMTPFYNLPKHGHFRNKYLDNHKGPLILYLGRLNIKKGIDKLIEAFSQCLVQYPNARLAIVGGGDPKKFEDQVLDWLIENDVQNQSVMTGPLFHFEKLSAFADADLFVLPSQAENFGHAIFEAMASRLPVVISDQINLAGEIHRNNAGLVVPCDVSAIVKAIISLLTDSQLRQRFGNNGLLLAKSYNWENTAEKIETAIECILQKKPFPSILGPINAIEENKRVLG